MTTDGEQRISLEEALKGLEQLCLSTESGASCSRHSERPNGLSEDCKEEESETRMRRSNSFSNRHNRRFAPYRIPQKRSSSCGSKECNDDSNSEANSQPESNRSSRDKLNTSSPRNASTCTQQALSVGGADGSLSDVRQEVDVDELSEYFAHFVEVQTKMSALAESMYA